MFYFFVKILLILLCLIPIRSLRKKIHKNLECILFKMQIKELERKYPKHFIIVPIYGLGETTCTALMMDEFKKRNKSKILFVVKNNNIAEYVKSFASVDDVIVKDIKFIIASYSLSGNFFKKFPGKFYPLVDYTLDKKLYSKNFTSESDLFDTISVYLGLDKNIKWTEFSYDKERELRIKSKYQLDVPTVLLSPEANSLNSNILSDNFWRKLSHRLRECNYKVLFNSTKKYDEAADYIFESIVDTVLIAKNCVGIIMFRSGLADVIAALVKDINMSVLFPSDDFQVYKHSSNVDMVKVLEDGSVPRDYKNNFANEVMKVQSLNRMFLRKDIEELFVYKDKEDELIEQLIASLKNKSIY